MSTKVVGLDLGTHTVKVCELVTTFRHYELIGFGSEPVDPDGGVAGRPSLQAIAAAARRLLERRGLLGETLMCALPSDYVSTVRLEFPFDQPKKIEAALPFQLEDAIPFDVEDVVHDYQVIRRKPDGGAEVIVAYVRRELVEAFLETLRREGIDPKVVGIGPLAHFNLYDSVLARAGAGPKLAKADDDADAPEAIAVLDVGHVHTELLVVDGDSPALVRNIAGGGLDVTRALAEVFGVELEQAERGKHAEGRVGPPPRPGADTQVDFDPEVGGSRRELISSACREALLPIVREVRRSLAAHFAATGHEVRCVYLTGGGSLLAGFAEWLADSVDVAVRRLDPLDVPFNKLAGDSDRLRPYIAKSLALSLRAFHRAHQSQINFRKGEYVYTGDFGFLRGRLITLGVAAMLMIVLGAMVAVSRKRVLEAEYATLTAQVRAVSKVILGEETSDIDRVFQVMVAAEKSDARLIPEVSAFEVLAELSEKVDPDLEVGIDRFELDMEHKKLILTGRTESGGDVERLVNALQRTRCFDENKVSKDRVEKTMNDQTKFRLTGTSICG